jgi:hypothetical protein
MGEEKHAIDEQEFLERLTENERLFFESKVRYNNLVIEHQEYMDFKSVLNFYIIQSHVDQWNEEIKIAPTIEEKIKLAEYRDLKLKEENRWTKKK